MKKCSTTPDIKEMQECTLVSGVDPLAAVALIMAWVWAAPQPLQPQPLYGWILGHRQLDNSGRTEWTQESIQCFE
jgi:hypothetical protein